MNVEQFFIDHARETFFYVPLTDPQGKLMGNIGDKLICRGTLTLLTRLGISLVNRPEDADWLLFEGGGYLRESFRVLPALVYRLCRQFPQKSVCVLPNSFEYSTKSLAEEFGERQAPTVFFAREEFSYAYLKSEFAHREGFTVALDHDMALHLAGEATVTERLAVHTKHILVVPRYDGEWKSTAPSVGWRAKLRRLFHYEQRKFAQWCARHTRDTQPPGASLPLLVTDLSAQPGLDLDGFCDVIAQSAAIYTSRLHVAIFASMLGRPTYMIDGSYHKFKGIFDFSLSRYPQTRFVSEPVC